MNVLQGSWRYLDDSSVEETQADTPEGPRGGDNAFGVPWRELGALDLAGEVAIEG